MDFGYISAIGLLIIVFGPIIYFEVKTKRLKRAMLNRAKVNTKYLEITRVNISRHESPSSIFKSPKERFILFSLLSIIAFLFIGFSLGLESKLFLYCFIGYTILTFSLIFIYDSIYIKKLLNKVLKEYYKNLTYIKSLDKEYIEGQIGAVGNVRRVHKLRCLVNQYKCQFSYFYDEMLIRQRSSSEDVIDSVFYKKIHNYISYSYDLSFLNIEKAYIQTTVSRLWTILADSRIIVDIFYSDGCLTVIKETLLYGYTSEDCKRDVGDIKLIYDSIISCFSEK